MSDECGIQEADLPGCFESGYADKFLPQLNPELVETVDEMKTFLRERNYIETDFAVEDWIDFEPLAEAYRARTDRLIYARDFSTLLDNGKRSTRIAGPPRLEEPLPGELSHRPSTRHFEPERRRSSLTCR